MRPDVDGCDKHDHDEKRLFLREFVMPGRVPGIHCRNLSELVSSGR
jgi:hypothetical protein